LSAAVGSSEVSNKKKRSADDEYYWQLDDAQAPSPGDAAAAVKRAPSFRLGKRYDWVNSPFDDLVRRAPTFRLGKRLDDKRAPSFRLGKRAPSFRLG